MTINKADISNTSTFGTWKTRTNELLAFARKTVSLGASGENNDGDLVLNGDLTLGSVNPTTDTLTVNNISKCATGDLKILNGVEVEGTLILDTGAGQVSKLQFNNGGATTYAIETASDHSYLEIGDGTSYIRFQADGSGGKEIDGEAIKINNDILPDEITAVNFTSTGTGADRSVLADVNISAGTISGLTSLESASATLTTVDIEAGTIDNTAIGTTTQSTGKFTSVDTVSNGDFTAHGTGGFKGDLKTSAGGTVVDVDATTPVLYGQSSGLTDQAIIEVLKAVYPIGSLFTSTANVDPSVARSPIFGTGGLGFGTWERYAEGRTLVGVDAEGSTGVVAGHTSEKSVANDLAGRGRSGVVYLTTFDHGLDVGDLIDINVGDNVTMDAYSSPNSPSDAFNPWAYTDANARGLEIIAIGGSSGTVGTGVGSGVPFVRFSIESLYTNMTSQQQADYDAIVSFKNFQVGGVDLTVSNGMTIRNSRFRNGLAKGGTSHVKLDPKHIPDHVHTMESYESGIQYYGFNDNNSLPAPKTGFEAFGTHTNTQYGTLLADEHRQQGPDSNDDGQSCSSTGVVKGYPGPIGIVDTDVDKGHENMPPYQVVYIYRRIA